jgi:predicted NBD/HSP70 family sugar kinase
VRAIHRITKSVVSAQDMKISNKKAILGMLKDNGPISRTKLAERLKLSKATVSSLVNDLLQENLVLETGAIQSSGVGRNAIELKFNAAYGYVFAVDVGRYKIRLAISDLNGEVLGKQYRETSSSRTVEDLMQHISDGVNELLAKPDIPIEHIRSMCVSLPGITDQNGVSKNTVALPQLNGVNFGERLSAIFPDIHIRIENDVRVAAVAENWKGFGEKYKSFVMLGIGSGLGCGFILNGQLYSGAYGAAGEVGFLKMSLGDKTPIEYDLSSDGIIQAANRLLGGGESYLADVKSVFQLVSEDTKKHQAFIDWFVVRVVYLMEVINCVINPEAIVLSGGIGRNLSFLMPALRERVSEINDPPQVEISGLSEDVQLIGATNIALSHVMEEFLA